MLRVGFCLIAFFALGLLSANQVQAQVVASPAPKSSPTSRLPSPTDSSPKEKPVYTLLEAINIALQNNPEILEAQKVVEEAQGDKIVARAGMLPALTTSGSYQHREDQYASQNGYDPNRTTEDWNVNIRLTQNFYNGQRVRSQMAAAKLLEQQRLLEYQGVVDEIVMEVRVAFYDILQARAAVEVRKQAVNLLEKQFVDQQNAFKLGTVGKLNVFRAEVSLANEMPSLLEAENNLADGKVRLSRLLAVPYLIRANAVPFDIEGTLEYKKIPVDLDDCLAKAEAFRPELKAKNVEIQIREKEIIVARSTSLPRVDGFIGYDVLNEPYINAPEDVQNGYVVGAQATWRIFDGFETAGHVKTARARVGASQQSRDATRLKILQEVRSAYYQVKQAEATVDSQEQNTTLARESYVLVQASFSTGLSTQLDILQSRSDLTNAQLAELNAKALHKTALARLQRAISSQVRLIQEQTFDAPLGAPAEKLPASATVLSPKTAPAPAPAKPAASPGT